MITFKMVSIPVHDLITGTIKESGLIYQGFDIKTEDERRPFMFLSASKEVFDLVKKGFIKDKIFKFDIKYQKFGKNGSIRVIKVY